MAAKKTDRKAKKESRFYIVKTMADAREKIETKVRTVNEKYVKKQVESGRRFCSELKDSPVKRIDDLIGDGKDVLKKVRKNRMDAIQKKVDTTKKDARKKFDAVSEKSQEIYNGLENDAKLVVEDVIEMGRKNLDRIPMKKTVEEKIKSGIDAVPARLNIPSREEIDNLVAGIDGLSKKVDALNREYANA